MSDYKWRFFKSGRVVQVKIENGADVDHLRELDPKLWTVLSCPVKGLRFDERTLRFLDSDGDGRVRLPEVLAAVDFLKSKGVDLDSLFRRDPADEQALADVAARQAALDKAPPSAEDLVAMKAWEEAPAKDAAILPFGDATAGADSALAAVEAVVDAFFAVPDDLPLVTEDEDKALPLRKNLNPKWADAVGAFAAVFAPGAEALSRADWAAAKARIAPYRAWTAAKPVMAADAKAKLEEEEKLLRYRLHLAEFLRNFVNQAGLYDWNSLAVYQTGTLYIDARAMPLSFHVDDAAAHSALAGRSECFLLYVKLTRKGGSEARNVCTAVTAGFAGSLWPGKNGVFVDRDGVDWDATVTQVVEKQISLREAFWAPWKKIFTTVSEQAKKFLGSKQDTAVAGVTAKATAAPAAAAQGAAGQNGAAVASSVAAIGIGVGMLGTACAALIGLVAGLPMWQVLLGVLCVILVVSLPSVVLTWFRLRRRDLGAILNACGWAVNRSLYFSMERAREFTYLAVLPPAARAARDPFVKRHPARLAVLLLLLLAAVAAAVWTCMGCPCCCR